MEKNQLQSCIVKDVKKGNNHTSTELSVNKPVVKNFILHALTNDSINIATRKSAFINQTANHEIIVSGPIVPIDGKDINFENEEEWDIGGIPELLNELDADIEKSLEYCNESSLKDNHDTSFTRGGLTISINDWISKNDGHSLEKRTCIKSVNELIGHNSTFPGYSKGGHLYSPISTSPNKVYTILKDTSSADTNWNSYKRDLSHSMSSQGGNLHSGTGNNAVSGGISNVSNNNQSGTQGNSNKSNSKMSIDHQATLDKGLKMKIKRTKPGTKTSEAKHEIVKATEQLQNGVAVNASIKEESSSAIPGSNPVPSTSQSNFGNSPTQNNALGGGSKKITGNSSSQMGNNFPCGASGGSNGAASSLISNISNVSSSASNKRSSSGHRREKMKEKTSHSIRTVSDKNISVNSEKDFTDKNVCNCSINDSTSTVCSSAICNRGNDGSTHRLSNPNLNSSVVPPGVFIPSSDSSSSASPLLSVSPAVSNSAVATHSSTINGSANTPGPPGKEPANSNIKISSHIAAQLAAVAASGTNNSDIKHPTANASSGLSKQSPHSNSIPVPLCKSNTSTAPLLLPIPPTTDENVKSPPAKRAKTDCSINENNTIAKETVDICVGTSIGTITEPDCLGPCEPGTSVTLEGIVWHETEGGVLVVNVTWRGKTYVGTLLDCTRHDWAPPRFCDSPSDELDSRTHKGRGKRGRGVPTPDLSNFTETRSSIYFSHPHVHSKLRNGSVKGSRGNSRTSNAAERNNGGSSISSGTGGSTPSTSPTAFLPPRREKRKSKDEPSSPTNVDSDSSSGAMVNASGIPISASGGAFASQPQSLINPVTGLNVQISTKRCKTAVPCALSPVLLECPEHDCSKKYKHANGLRYHQSHAHGNLSIADDDSVADIDETHITPLNSPGIVSIPAESEELGNFSALMIVEPSALKISDSTKTKLPHTEVVLSAFDLDKASRAEADLTPSAMSTDLLNAVNKSVLNMSAEISNMGKDTGEPDDKKTGDNTILPSAEDVDSSSQSPSSKRSLRFTPSDTKHSDSGLLERDETSNLNHSESSSSLSEQLDSKTHSRTTIPLVSKDDDQSSPQGVKPDTIKINTDSCLSNPDKVIEINCKSPSNTASSKPKKGRKSPPITGLDVDEFKRCNIASREEVQSPAYSDISDDSTSVNDQQQIEKLHSTKSVDVNKKSQDIVMTTGSVCPSGSQPSMTSPLSGYGMYQFYQQQQFLLQSSIDQQSSKNNLATNMVQPVIPSSQQSANSTESSRKEPPLDLITKPIPPTLQQIASPSSQDSEKEAIPPQGNVSSSATGGLSSSATSKPISHFYAFNYVSPSYQFNVDQNYAPLPVNAEEGKGNRHLGILSPSEQQQPVLLFKEDRRKEDSHPNDSTKVLHQQQGTPSKQIKSESATKAENIKSEPVNNISSPMSHIPLNNKDLGSYSNVYSRHPVTLPSQQTSREEELRRYYIFNDQQRRQNSILSNNGSLNQQVQGNSPQTNQPQCRDDSPSTQGNVQTQQQIKIKSNASLGMLSNSGKITSTTKESPKHKQDEETKTIKQEGQKPTMETQGPPPPPTSQYFLHPSYIAPTPFGFDPNHPMYRNVLMPPTSPYNAAPYHLPMPRYHTPEDLSRNAGPKALDVLHHAASQYYTTHKIHELSERALKSPNNGSNNGSNTAKVSVSSPTLSTVHLPNMSTNSLGHHSNTTQSPQTITSNSNKQDVLGQKALCGPIVGTNVAHELQKPPSSSGSPIASNSAIVTASGSGADSRSPPPQRHVHTHHHTHVGLGYPMYPAPYGAAVLASQQAAAVAVINPFPPGPTK